MRLIWAVIPFFLFVIIGFEESFGNVDFEFGEYDSLGNIWVELTHSAANQPPWRVDWKIEHPVDSFPKDWLQIDGEISLIKQFYKKHDIEIIDVVKSGKNSQMCEAIGCLFGTYHLLIPEKDLDRYQQFSWGYYRFADYGFGESRAVSQEDHTAHWEAKKILVTTDGDIEFDLSMKYDSEDPNSSYYYCSTCGGPVHVADGFKFLDSVVFLKLPHTVTSEKIIGILNDGDSSDTVNVNYKGKIDIGTWYPPKHNFDSIGLNWVRVFEDDLGEKYYQWMRSNTEFLLLMNKPHSLNGTFSVSSPYPESLRYPSPDFDYVSWFENNLLTDWSKNKEFISEDEKTKTAISTVNRFQHSFDILYEIDSGNEVLKVGYEEKSRLFFNILSRTAGNLTVHIPHHLDNMVDCQPRNSNSFIVKSNDISKVEYSLLSDDTSDVNILQIPFTEHTNEITIFLNGDKPRNVWNRCDVSPDSDYASLLPPLKQISNGETVQDVFCSENYELVFKTKDSIPACVDSDSKGKLFERNWAMPEYVAPLYSVSDLKLDDNKIEKFHYSLSAGTRLLDAVKNSDGSLSFFVGTTASGVFNVDIRDHHHLPKFRNGMPYEAFVLIDGEESEYGIKMRGSTAVFSIPFKSGIYEISVYPNLK